MGVEAHIMDCSYQRLSIEEGHMNISSRVSCDAEVSEIYLFFLPCGPKRMFEGLISLCIKSFECTYWIVEIC
jgi:hypothetical protein